MTDISIEADAFGKTVEQILGRLETGVEENTPEAVEMALQSGEQQWKKNARSVLSKSYSRGGWGKARKGAVRYKSGAHKGEVKSGWYGKTFKTGRYARSIHHHMMTQGGDLTEGEIGSPSMPGLAHLLEKGHGFFPASPHVHIEPAADFAFKDFERFLDRAIDRAINDI